MSKLKPYRRLWAVTLLELLVVVLIISILSTIATGVYTNQTRRARIAATQDLIHQLSMAITRYEVDTGSFPPSGSGASPVPGSTRSDGSGYLHLALLYSLSGNSYKPASPLWQGPYINVQADQLTNVNSTTSTASSNTSGMINFLDSWQSPILYIANGDYAGIYNSSFSSSNLGSFSGGTKLFATQYTAGPPYPNPNLPDPSPFVSQGETYYNTSTYQIISYGPNGYTLPGYHGAEVDDVTNFGY